MSTHSSSADRFAAAHSSFALSSPTATSVAAGGRLCGTEGVRVGPGCVAAGAQPASAMAPRAESAMAIA
ncbi:hypothetical protein [Paramicrobacterium humi]|uniref:hypothetical protein n=1 Tax=Paramicrobacterium humi TaxID=640635 RepID=UPI00115FC8DD|nr:hypothetical protein [Microbacterium humi]